MRNKNFHKFLLNLKTKSLFVIGIFLFGLNSLCAFDWYGGTSTMIDCRIYSNHEAQKPRKLSTKKAIEVSIKDFFDLLNDKEKAKDVYLRLPLDLQDSCGEVAKEFSDLFTIEQFRCISDIAQDMCNALKMDFHKEEDLFYFKTNWKSCRNYII